ncbi:hypothetical protein C8R47DRAFT_652447 [Mycena vitilis]|nr:hypothetical protein C8R47DRAFT_652447 [Mycena vitilis]
MNLLNAFQLVAIALSALPGTAAAPSFLGFGDDGTCADNGQDCVIAISATVNGETIMSIMNADGHKCIDHTISKPGGDFCGIPFTLGATGNWTIEGCGGKLSAKLNNEPFAQCNSADVWGSAPCPGKIWYICQK